MFVKSNSAKRCVKFQHQQIDAMPTNTALTPEIRFQLNTSCPLSLK
jgi:hypothetical protein